MTDEKNTLKGSKLDKDSQDNKIDKSILREEGISSESDDDDKFYDASDTPFDDQKNVPKQTAINSSSDTDIYNQTAKNNHTLPNNNTTNNTLRKHTVKERVAQIETGGSTAQVDITTNSTPMEVDGVITRSHVKRNVQKFEQLQNSSNADTRNRTTKNNQRLYNTAMQAGQGKRKRSDAIGDAVQSDALYNSSLPNNTVQTNKSEGINNTTNNTLRKHTVKERVAQIETGGSTAQVDITTNSTPMEVDGVITRSHVKRNVQKFEQLQNSSNADTRNRTTKNNQRLYNTAMQAGQGKRKRSDAIGDAVQSDAVAKKIRTSALYNSSLPNNTAQTNKLETVQQLPTSHSVNSVVQDPNTPPKTPKSQQSQSDQLYNNAQQENSVTSTHVANSGVDTSPTSQSTTSQPASQLNSPSQAEDKIALDSTNHNGLLQAFQELQQLLHEILSADEKYQEWQQQNPDKTPHDFQQDSKLVQSISNETKKLLEDISLSGTANIVGSSKNTQYAQANSFANKLQDLNWYNSEESANQTVNNTFPGMVNTTQKVNMSFDVNGNTQYVSRVRRVTIPTSLSKEDEAASVALVLLDKNGNRPPESKALYFTAHYSSNEGGKPKLTDITYPKPLQFCSDAPDSPCYVLQGNEAYFLPINRQELQNLLKDIDLNKGIEREPVAQDKIITNSPLAQDKIITNSLQPKNQHDRALQSTTPDASDIVKVTSSNNGMQLGNNATSILENMDIDDITTNLQKSVVTSLQNSKAPTPRNMRHRNIMKKRTRTPGR